MLYMTMGWLAAHTVQGHQSLAKQQAGRCNAAQACTAASAVSWVQLVLPQLTIEACSVRQSGEHCSNAEGWVQQVLPNAQIPQDHASAPHDRRPRCDAAITGLCQPAMSAVPMHAMSVSAHQEWC